MIKSRSCFRHSPRSHIGDALWNSEPDSRQQFSQCFWSAFLVFRKMCFRTESAKTYHPKHTPEGSSFWPYGIYIHIHIYIYVCICTHEYIYVCVYTCKYIHLYTHISSEESQWRRPGLLHFRTFVTLYLGLLLENSCLNGRTSLLGLQAKIMSTRKN